MVGRTGCRIGIADADGVTNVAATVDVPDGDSATIGRGRRHTTVPRRSRIDELGPHLAHTGEARHGSCDDGVDALVHPLPLTSRGAPIASQTRVPIALGSTTEPTPRGVQCQSHAFRAKSPRCIGLLYFLGKETFSLEEGLLTAKPAPSCACAGPIETWWRRRPTDPAGAHESWRWATLQHHSFIYPKSDQLHSRTAAQLIGCSSLVTRFEVTAVGRGNL